LKKGSIRLNLVSFTSSYEKKYQKRNSFFLQKMRIFFSNWGWDKEQKVTLELLLPKCTFWRPNFFFSFYPFFGFPEGKSQILWRSATEAGIVVVVKAHKQPTSVNFINILWAAFINADSESAKRYWQLDWIFTLWDLCA